LTLDVSKNWETGDYAECLIVKNGLEWVAGQVVDYDGEFVTFRTVDGWLFYPYATQLRPTTVLDAITKAF
jgi:hypothetical protein